LQGFSSVIFVPAVTVISLDEMIQSFNFVFDEMCHGTGSAANCDFDVEE